MVNITDIQDAIVAELKTITSPAVLDAAASLDVCGFTASDLPFAWVRRDEVNSVTSLAAGVCAVVRTFPIWLYVKELIGAPPATDSQATFDSASAWVQPMLSYWWDRQFLTTASGKAYRVVGWQDTGDIGLFGRENSRRFTGVIFNLLIETIEQRG